MVWGRVPGPAGDWNAKWELSRRPVICQNWQQGGLRQKCSACRAPGCQRAFLRHLDPGVRAAGLTYPPSCPSGLRPLTVKQSAWLGSAQLLTEKRKCAGIPGEMGLPLSSFFPPVFPMKNYPSYSCKLKQMKTCKGF